jgi:hypothetical protein
MKTYTSARRGQPKDTVASVSEAIAKMRAAADKHLSDRSAQERQEWAERTARSYIAKGIISVVVPSAPYAVESGAR